MPILADPTPVVTPAGTPAIVSIGALSVTGVDASNVEWLCTGLDGWWSAGSVEAATTKRPRQDGSFADSFYTGTRSLNLEVTILAGTAAARRAAVESLLSAVDARFADTALSVEEDGVSRRCWVRRSGEVLANASDTWAIVSIPFLAADPLRYATEMETVTAIYDPTTSGGIQFDLAFNLSFGALSIVGRIDAANPGTAPTRPVVTFKAPLGEVVGITNETTGKRFGFHLGLTGAQQLVVDCKTGTAMLDGIASRLDYLDETSVPLEEFELVPGMNTLRLESGVSTPGGSADIDYYPAWV